jgi:restriction system protein
MKSAGLAVWGIRAGERGEADALFLKNDVVALALDEIGPLHSLAIWEAIKLAIAKSYPKKTAMAAARNAGQLFHFIHDMSIDDLVVYPSRIDKRIHIGRVKGSYYYDLTILKAYPHRRGVQWLVNVSRDGFSRDALFEMGSATAFFRIRRHAGEFQEALDVRRR